MSQPHACISENYCDLVAFIENTRRDIPYGEINIQIRRHQIVHADVTVITRKRISLRDTPTTDGQHK